jgi:RNase P/RNase MRP subunit POP5
MMRRKIRYVLVESTAPIPEASRSQFEYQLYRALLRAIGEISYHKANPKIIKFLEGNTFVLRCNLEGYRSTLLALSFVKKLEEKEASFYTLKSSGTIKALLK